MSNRANRAISSGKLKSHQLRIEFTIVIAGGEIIEGAVRDMNDVSLDKRRSFERAVYRMLEAVPPFHDGPAGKIVPGHF